MIKMGNLNLAGTKVNSEFYGSPRSPLVGPTTMLKQMQMASPAKKEGEIGMKMTESVNNEGNVR